MITNPWTQPAPLTPPGWATTTLVETDGITHERTATARAALRAKVGVGWTLVPADTSLSSTDTLDETGWHRSNPTVVVEGGNYPLDGVRQLRDALDELLRIADADNQQLPQPH